MIDNLALAITHGLMILAAWLLLARRDLDAEGPVEDRSMKPRRAPRRGSDPRA